MIKDLEWRIILDYLTGSNDVLRALIKRGGRGWGHSSVLQHLFSMC
jgi:hypothetical protein